MWTPTDNEFGWTAYVGHRPTLAESRPYVAASRRVDLSGLPPAWIGVGDLDLFYEEDVEYARRLEAAGVPCELHVVPGLYHGGDFIAKTATASIDFHVRLTESLRAAVSPQSAAAVF
jgi:acetyl esterase/lipase